MNKTMRQEAMRLDRLVNDMEFGETARFSERYLHELTGVKISAGSLAARMLAQSFALESLSKGDIEEAASFADIHEQDPAILGDTSIREWLDVHFTEWTIDKPNMIVTATR